MKLVIVLFTGVMLTSLAGCLLRGKPRAATTPPPPKPAATAPAPAAPIQEPLSIPQTNVTLPSPQPISPEALASIPEPAEAEEEPPEPARPPRVARRPPPAAPAPAPPPAPKPETPAPQVVEERPRIQPIVPADEQRRILELIETRKREINERLDRVGRRELSAQEQGVVARIHSFLDLSDQAAKRGDMGQADTLSERALILVRELALAK